MTNRGQRRGRRRRNIVCGQRIFWPQEVIMTRDTLHQTIIVSASVLALAIVAAPVQFQTDGAIVLDAAAFAQGNSGGNGGG